MSIVDRTLALREAELEAKRAKHNSAVWHLRCLHSHEVVKYYVFSGRKPGRISLSYAGVPESIAEKIMKDGFAVYHDFVWVLYMEGKHE